MRRLAEFLLLALFVLGMGAWAISVGETEPSFYGRTYGR